LTDACDVVASVPRPKFVRAVEVDWRSERLLAVLGQVVEARTAESPRPKFVRIVVAVPSERLFVTLKNVEDDCRAASPRPKFERAVEVLFRSERLFDFATPPRFESAVAALPTSERLFAA